MASTAIIKLALSRNEPGPKFLEKTERDEKKEREREIDRIESLPTLASTRLKVHRAGGTKVVVNEHLIRSGVSSA